MIQVHTTTQLCGSLECGVLVYVSDDGSFLSSLSRTSVMNSRFESSVEPSSVKTLTPATIYLIDPDPTTQQAFAAMCEAIECKLVTFGSIANFIKLETLQRPACLACDLLTAKQSGFDLKSEMQMHGNSMPVIFLSDLRDIDVAVDVTGRGGWTLIRKPIEIAQADFLFVGATETDRRNVELESMRSSIDSVLQRLTARQRGVLRCVVEGMPTRAIAREFGVSTRLIELERSELLKAFGVSSTPDLTLRMGEYRMLQRFLIRRDPPHVALRHPMMMDQRAMLPKTKTEMD